MELNITARRFNYVAVSVAAPRFLPVPVDGGEAKGQGETVKSYQVRVKIVIFV
jgi:hypothetical protein